MRLFRSRKAQEDLIGIWLHIASDNEAAADRLLDRFESRLQMLVSFPELGTTRDDIRAGLRMLVEGEYLLLYRILDQEVELVRVVHGRRDLEGLDPE